MVTIRKPVVAGRFYPDERGLLQSTIREFLSTAAPGNASPKGIIVPHAGYVYSGAVAAAGYAQLMPVRKIVCRVVLLGPAHFVPIEGLAACHADEFETPLGRVPIDTLALRKLHELPQVHWLDAAHAPEHSLEVHVPFLQTVLAEFRLVPLVVGHASVEEVAEVIELLWDGPETIFVISSDLSHFHDYETAERLDRETSEAIVQLRYEDLGGERACGYRPISGLLSVARRRGLQARLLDLRNSGDTAGPRDRVVGYGAYVLA